MSILKGILRTGDFVYAVRFLRLLTTKWENTGAFKAGIIDKDGNVLRKAETAEDKNVYNVFHKLVFNIKKLINKIPFIGKATLTSYAAALYLIKEHTGMSDKKIKKILEEAIGTQLEVEDNRWNLNENRNLMDGIYVLNKDIANPQTGDLIAFKGSRIKVYENNKVGSICGVDIFEAYHMKTKQKIYISNTDISII